MRQFSYQFDFLGTSKTLDQALKANSYCPGTTCKGGIDDVKNTLETLRSALRSLEIPPEEDFYAILRAHKHGQDWSFESDPMTFPEMDEVLQFVLGMGPNEDFEPLHIKGDCNVIDLSEDERNRLVSVSRCLYVQDVEGVNLPNLQEVGRDLFAQNSRNVEMPKLERVGSSLFVGESENFCAAVLREVEEYVYAHSSKNLSMPVLQDTGAVLGLWKGEETSITIPMELAVKYRIPVHYLSDATLSQAAQNQESENPRNQQKL